LSLTAAPLLMMALMRSPATDSLCASHTQHADPSLYCIPLLSTDLVPLASGSGVMQLESSPFGLAVTPDGRTRYKLVLTLSGLPDPRSLGPYHTYVAWATTPELEPMIPLGEVQNGRSVVGPIALDRLVIMVSAEQSSAARVRRGQLVLRGSSPSLFMVPHGVTVLPPQSAVAHDHAGHGWPMPPMHPQVSRMPFGLERLRPGVGPFLPTPTEETPAPVAQSRPYRMADGDTITLTASKVTRMLRGHPVVMYAYNGQIPGPRLEVTRGSTVIVRFLNRTDLPGSIHWHGLRLSNENDGVPGITQPPVPPGGEFTYRVHAPDAGLFWYHPHQRSDIAQDLGLAGNIVVREPHERPARESEAFLMLDDLLMTPDGLVPYGDEGATHALMGRFGNTLLVNGGEDWRLRVRPEQPLRLRMTNAASARTFNLSIDGARLRALGGDAGLFPSPRPVENVVIAPSERYTVEARFRRSGKHALVNRVRAIDRMTGRFFSEVDTLGVVTVAGPPFPTTPAEIPAEDSLAAVARSFMGRPADRVILLTLRTRNLPFGLIQALRLDTAFVQPVEWTSTMPMMDWLSSTKEVTWILRDSVSGAEGMALDWRVPRGKPLVVRLVNDKHVLHPMGHPIHLHGQRFLVLARNGVPNGDLAWKDTVLVPAGGTVDLLVDTNNPGRWMLHCHIAEHLEAGMHTLLTIE
jgi:suppressor of ftsI